VLDGSQATTCSTLQQRGVNLSRVLVPNIYTASVASLRKRGVPNAFCCDVQDLLEQVLPTWLLACQWCPQPWTLNPQPATRNPQPQPATRNDISSTLYYNALHYRTAYEFQ